MTGEKEKRTGVLMEKPEVFPKMLGKVLCTFPSHPTEPLIFFFKPQGVSSFVKRRKGLL